MYVSWKNEGEDLMKTVELLYNTNDNNINNFTIYNIYTLEYVALIKIHKMK